MIKKIFFISYLNMYISNVTDINVIFLNYFFYSLEKYIKKLLGIPCYILKRVNWNIIVTLGKEIKRDSMISVNESRKAYIKNN